ncbi:hypothetical protein [Consotaella salsifontis]|uniref:hypothetical protein n=1 Tax=Consotaella salsifontis TaxID=1365950 RepID=UPI0010543E65|nr:hypothetical protein [Consotaella salsifontis]
MLSATALPAFADQNTLTILQQGSGNALSVDQSAATNSEVKGLSITSGEPTAGSGLAPGNRKLNELGLEITLTDEARQLGNNNDATVTMSGNGGKVYLYQNNPAIGPSGGVKGNSAEINSLAGGVGLVSQDGIGNVANLTVTGGLGGDPALIVGGQRIDGAIIQRGSGNYGTVITGSSTDALLVQNGSSNKGALDVTGSVPGSSVVFTQNGNNMNSAAAAQVYTNVTNGTVSVTQNSFSSVGAQVSVTQTAR